MRLGVLLLVTACGRLGFDQPRIGSSTGDGSSAGDSGVVIDGDHSRANVAFTTSMTFPGDLGGVEGADRKCADAAAAAGRPGTFRAYLSTPAVNASSRFVGSRGWIRSDGAAAIDQLSDAFGGKLLNAIDHDENGAQLSLAGPSFLVWTASRAGAYDDSSASATNCNGWTDTVGSALAGSYDRGDDSFEVATYNLSNPPCASSAHLYCFEVGYDYPVSPVVSSGRIAFMGTGAGPIGLSGYDAQCQADATAAGLGGTFLAARATSTSSVAGRFLMTTPWIRPDGTLIAPTAQAMFDGSVRLSVVNQAADGTYVNVSYYSTGAAPMANGTNQSTCMDWTTINGNNSVAGVMSISPSVVWDSETTVRCPGAGVLCLQN